ncbi:hypothetical protein IMG5_055170 [Ichthyophthirius multifiliis]|uniref:NADP-dependent oxidoreductase domain-containing protein n=1 Tax=Ichthyophthirius multifiliis TaxID=5932 RepID=G0QN45_ICHMU|nr:hypothetical protein IMG5_055170 [Ichthyophthirius multifiliis]EGR33374.1 hypothetical protein IMG5_055170 [Ichthyophthirius multifiliis]|eukprot:XP_004037360.1 hypothetical protein IMG5_055170 [Ichthyophthirius multifiliis]
MLNNDQQFILHNGNLMPIFGLGTYTLTDKQQLDQLIRYALKSGYKHIDTAITYANEALIGEILEDIFKEEEYKREELFIATKIFPYKSVNTVLRIQQCLKDLKLQYIDMIYIHWPGYIPDKNNVITHKPVHQIWAEFEQCYRLGYVRNLAVSNFNVQSLFDLLSYCQVKPVCNQIELNVQLQQPKLLDFCKRFKIHIVAYSPLARCGDILKNSLLVKLSEKYGKSVVQIMLNFLIRLGVSVIPKTSNFLRLKENIESIQFQLSEEDFQLIKSLDKNIRVEDPYARDDFGSIPYFD